MGITNVLGALASGWNQEADLDKEKQYRAEMSKRQQAADWLGKLAQDPTAHPETRQKATQSWLDLHDTPITKPYKPPKLEDLMTPGHQPGLQTVPQPPPGMGLPANLGPGEPPPGAHPPMALPSDQFGPGRPSVASPEQATFQAPTPPPSLWMTPEEQAAQAAALQQTLQAGKMGSGIGVRLPSGDLGYQPISEAGTTMGQPIPGYVTPAMLKPNLRELTVLGDDGLPIPATKDMQTGLVRDSAGRVIDNPHIFNGKLVGTTATSFSTMDDDGNIHTYSTHSPVISTPGGKPAAGKPTPPPGMSTGAGGAKPKAEATTGMTNTNPQTAWMHAKDPVTLQAARAAMTGEIPTETRSQRQVLSRMKQLGLGMPPIKIPPEMQLKVQESFVARNSAIDIIDDILKHKQVFNSMLDSGAIDFASNPDGTLHAVASRALSDEAAQVAGDFQQLSEHANLLRGPLGATGFRGKEAWGALQAQRGKALQNPKITEQVLTGMRERLANLNSADKFVMLGHGMDVEPPPASGGGGGDGQVTVVDPKGKPHVFPDQASADAFKKAAGIQ